jgi:peptidyl-tRNA hydrolase
MYILVLNNVPLGHAMNSAAHASLACYKKFETDPDVIDWFENSFKKVTCKVSKQELLKAMSEEGKFVKITESALGGALTSVAFCPRKTWHKCFSYLPLYK